MRTNRFLLLLPVAMGCASLQAASGQPVAGSSASPTTQANGPAGTIAAAARHPFVGAAWKGPAPQALPGTVRVQPHPNAHKSSIPKSAQIRFDAAGSTVRPDGQRGFVELLSPPPDTDAGIESRFYELPPAPEN
jgi:hypothetical protein